MMKLIFFIFFGTQVKKAFFALVANGVRAAPLWDSEKQSFVGKNLGNQIYVAWGFSHIVLSQSKMVVVIGTGSFHVDSFYCQIFFLFVYLLLLSSGSTMLIKVFSVQTGFNT